MHRIAMLLQVRLDITHVRAHGTFELFRARVHDFVASQLVWVDEFLVTICTGI